MSTCCTCGGSVCKESAAGWKYFFVSIAVLFPLGIALYNCTKWLDIKAKIKKARGDYRDAIEQRSELLLLEDMLKEAKEAESSHSGGKGDGPPPSGQMWRRDVSSPNF